MVEVTTGPDGIAIEAHPGSNPVLENVVLRGNAVGIPAENMHYVPDAQRDDATKISFSPPPPLGVSVDKNALESLSRGSKKAYGAATLSGPSILRSPSIPIQSLAKFDRKPLLFGAFGAAGGILGVGLAALVWHLVPGAARNDVFVLAPIGGSLASCLWLAQNWYQKNRWSPAIAAAGALWGVMSGVGGYIAAVPFHNPMKGSIEFCAGTLTMCGLQGFLLSKRIPNLQRYRAFIGGILGGTVGLVIFSLCAGALGLLEQRNASFAAAIAGVVLWSGVEGFSLGFMIALAEILSRKCWLEVKWPDNGISLISLGKRPITIGSSNTCDLVDKSMPCEIAARIWAEGTVVKYQAHSSNETLADLGKLSLIVRGRPGKK